MTTMKAARVHEWGSPEVFLDEVPIPEPKSDQILIRVRASSINPIDWKAQAGYVRYLQLPLLLGWDVAGEVVALGSDVGTGINIGDAVSAKTGPGGIAEYAVAPANEVALKPKTLDYRATSTLPAAGMTAWQGLFDHGGLQAGQKVLIHGAAGGVGHFAVQLARWKGAHVIGTGSADNEAFIRELGADAFIDYHAARFEDVVQDADIVLDTVGGETLERSYAATKPGGIVISIAGRHAEDKARERGVRIASFSSASPRKDMDTFSRAIDAGYIKPTISAVYPIEQVREALEQIKAGHTRGKIVIDIP